MRPFTLAHTFAADDYRSLADLSGELGGAVVLVEGFIQAQTNSLTVRFGDETTPAATAPGLVLGIGSVAGIGPTTPGAAWPLSRIWVRNTTAGSNGLVVAIGTVS